VQLVHPIIELLLKVRLQVTHGEILTGKKDRRVLCSQLQVKNSLPFLSVLIILMAAGYGGTQAKGQAGR
jgi:hypothetical protein